MKSILERVKAWVLAKMHYIVAGAVALVIILSLSLAWTTKAKRHWKAEAKAATEIIAHITADRDSYIAVKVSLEETIKAKEGQIDELTAKVEQLTAQLREAAKSNRRRK